MFENKSKSDIEEIKSNECKIVPYGNLWTGLSRLLLSISFIMMAFAFGIPKLANLLSNAKLNGIANAILTAPKFIFTYAFAASIVLLLAFIFIQFRYIRYQFDPWILDIAKRKLSTECIWYRKNVLFIHYDVNVNHKDLMDFIREISDKSTKYTYYFTENNINRACIEVFVSKKQDIPIKATLDKQNDTQWNIIPLGDAVNHELKSITPISWMLNDENKRDDIVQTMPSTSLLISGGTGSGKSVLQQCIVGHISRFPDNFMMIGCDVKQVEFNNFIGVSSIKKIALSIEDTEEAIKKARQIMTDRFTFMRENGVNNIYKLNGNVDYYSVGGKLYQFDELFSCYINGVSTFAKMEDIYQSLHGGKKVQMDESYGVIGNLNNSMISLNDIVKVSDRFKPKAIVIMIDEMSEVMSGGTGSNRYRLVDSINESIGSIARLGRAAGVHLVLATQRPSSNVINSDLKNNIQQSVLLGSFDSSASTLIFDDDISHLAKPKIKGRGFIKSGNDILEFQSYWTEPEKDFQRNTVCQTQYEKMENSNDNDSNKVSRNRDRMTNEVEMTKKSNSSRKNNAMHGNGVNESDSNVRNRLGSNAKSINSDQPNVTKNAKKTIKIQKVPKKEEDNLFNIVQ